MAYSYTDLTYGNTPVLPKSDLKEPALTHLHAAELENAALADAIEDLIWAEAQMDDFVGGSCQDPSIKWCRVTTSTKAAMHSWLWDNMRIATFALKLRSQYDHSYVHVFGERVQVLKCFDDAGKPQLQIVCDDWVYEEDGHKFMDAWIVTYDLECP